MILFTNFINKYSHIFVFSSIITIFAPLNILYKNYQILVFDLTTLNVIIFISLIIFSFLCIFLLLLKKFRSQIIFLNSYFILILITSKIINDDNSYFIIIAIDACIILISYLSLKFFKKFLIMFFFFLFCTISINFILDTINTYNKTKNLFSHKKFLKLIEKKNNLSKNNVYHIVLDGFQYDTFSKLKEKKLINIPKEFIVLKNFYTEFESTNLSLSLLLDQDRSDKIDYNNSNLIKNLYENNTNIYLYTKNEPSSKFALVHRNTYDYKSIYNKTENYFNTIILLFDYTFLNLSPYFIKKYLKKYKFDPKIGLYGFSFSNWISNKILMIDQYKQNLPSVVDWPYWSAKVFKQLINDETQRSNKNNYIFAHLVIPHGPYVLDEKGNFYKNEKENLNLMERYENQAIYSMKLMNDFFETLKKNKRYEDSLIIIHSDHGFFFSKNDILNDNYTKSISSKDFGPLEFDKINDINNYINSWGKGLLLVKPPKIENVKIDKNFYYQLRHIKNLIEENFYLKKTKTSKGIFHYISNDEHNIDNYNLFSFNKNSKNWEFKKNIDKDKLNINDIGFAK